MSNVITIPRIPLMKRGSREDWSYLPITLGTLDSLDYWTDPVVMSSVRPLSAQEINFNAEQSHANQAQCRPQRRKS